MLLAKSPWRFLRLQRMQTTRGGLVNDSLLRARTLIRLRRLRASLNSKLTSSSQATTITPNYFANLTRLGDINIQVFDQYFFYWGSWVNPGFSATSTVLASTKLP